MWAVKVFRGKWRLQAGMTQMLSLRQEPEGVNFQLDRRLRQEDCSRFQVSLSNMNPCPKMDGRMDQLKRELEFKLRCAGSLVA